MCMATSATNAETVLHYAPADQALLRQMLLGPLERSGLAVRTEHRPVTRLVKDLDELVRRGRPLLIAMSAVTVRAMLASAEILRYHLEQIGADLPLWLVLLDEGVPHPLLAPYRVWDIADAAGGRRRLAHLIRRLAPPRRIALLTPGATPHAEDLAAGLRRLGHQARLISATDTGWAPAVQAAIAGCDDLLMPITADAAGDLIAAIGGSAIRQFQSTGKPRIIPILADNASPSPDLAATLAPWPVMRWDGHSQRRLLSETVRSLALSDLEAKGDDLPDAEDDGGHYLERDADRKLRRALRSERGITINIQGLPQSGKSTLLRRGLAERRERQPVLHVMIDRIDPAWLGNLDLLVRYLARCLARVVGIAEPQIDQHWSSVGGFSATTGLTQLVEQVILPALSGRLMLVIDNADRLLSYDYALSLFGMLRSWHNLRAHKPIWGQLDLILTIAADVQFLIRDVNQSPFNIGEKIYIDDFNTDELSELNERYGDPLTADELAQLADLLGGHPALSRRILAAWPQQPEVSLRDLPPMLDHARSCEWALTQRPELRRSLAEIRAAGRCSDERAFLSLVQLGFVKGDDPQECALRCQWYREVIGGLIDV